MYSSQVREKDGLDQGGSGGGEKCLEPGYTLKVELSKCVDELEVEYEERGVRMNPILGLSDWEHVAAFV